MLRNPVSTIITLATRIADEHPRAAQLAYRIRAEAEELRAEPQPRPISAAPTDDPERTFLLFCPEQGGWQTGVFFEGRWRDFATLTEELEPTHFPTCCPIRSRLEAAPQPAPRLRPGRPRVRAHDARQYACFAQRV